MRITAVILGIVFLIACGGGGGGDAAVFLFRGLWLTSFTETVDTCGITEGNTSGSLSIDISQAGNVVTALPNTFPSPLSGLAQENSFSAANDVFGDIRCPDTSVPSDPTTTLEFNGASGDVADVALLRFFFSCPGFENQCELSFQGSALRLSGEGGGTGDLGNNPDFVNEDPLF